MKGYTGLQNIASVGVNLKNPEEVIRSVRNDPNAIGFLKLADNTGASGKEFIYGLRILPVDKNKNGKIDYMEAIYNGVDDFLQHVTGPVTRLEMRRPGEKVRKGDMILSLIQNGKRLVVFAPVSGVIKESNSLLDSKYTLINSSPYTDGWVYRIEPVNWLREIQFMEMAEKYQTWLSSEFNRLKDFLASSLKVNKLEYDAIVLQDGGMLKDGVLEDFGPEVWEDFQSNFLDTTF